jgi:hypothetical protein
VTLVGCVDGQVRIHTIITLTTCSSSCWKGSALCQSACRAARGQFCGTMQPYSDTPHMTSQALLTPTVFLCICLCMSLFSTSQNHAATTSDVKPYITHASTYVQPGFTPVFHKRCAVLCCAGLLLPRSHVSPVPLVGRSGPSPHATPPRWSVCSWSIGNQACTTPAYLSHTSSSSSRKERGRVPHSSLNSSSSGASSCCCTS